MPQLLLTNTSPSASINAGLIEALWLLEQRLATWSSNQDAFSDLLHQVFGLSPGAGAESAALQATISSSGLGISLQILDAITIDGLNAAYTSAAPNGHERIYLNASWLELAAPDQIEAVLLEELGHAIDWRLNGFSDSADDEGAIFSALLRGKTPDPAADRENDQHILNIDGVAVAVEASSDTTLPKGNLISAANPAYVQQGGIYPFGISSVGIAASPAFADIDDDDDLDLFIGHAYGKTYFFRNTAAPDATAPAYSKLGWWESGDTPFGIPSVGKAADPAVADIDDDGDLDLFIGESGGYTVFLRNTGSESVPAYTQEGGITPFGLTDVGRSASPALADIDGDGDLDLFIGNDRGNINVFFNTAAPDATTPAYTSYRVKTPFGIPDVGYAADPAFADIDDDGDLDLFIGTGSGNTLFFRNTAAPGANAPAYTQEGGDSPFGITDVGRFSSPALADADGDGDLDLFIGEINGRTLFFRNTAATPIAPVNTTTGNGTYGVGAVINLTVSFSEPVVVDTTGGIPTLQLETGTNDRYATYASGSGSSTLTFEYVVQDGDHSTDLDQLSSTALALNGGTIADVAGNAAILTLAAPGKSGSLAANADLVIEADFTRPRGSQGSFATVPIYTQEDGDTPFGINNASKKSRPAFADIDDDGDFDLFIGNENGYTTFFRNIGSARVPAYTQEGGDSPFGIQRVGQLNTTYNVWWTTQSSPALADIDDDGDLDLFIGKTTGYTTFFRNTGSARVPAYTREGDNKQFFATPFGITAVPYGHASPALGDADDDGDLDLFIGTGSGKIIFFRNTGSASAPAYTREGDPSDFATPFGISVGSLGNASPALADIDGDGMLDLMIGNNSGFITFFRNTAARGATTPAFTQQGGTSPFGITTVDYAATPSLVDIDSDGDLDLFIGTGPGKIIFFRNTAATPIAPVNTITDNGTYGVGAVINLTVSFNEEVVVDTTGGTPTLQLETGTNDRYATYTSGTGTNTLTFQYTVQGGDSSADLDQLSSTALTLNGGTIADVAGNAAILTLAAPGKSGSLAANADLVIEGLVPTVTGVASITADGTYGIGAVINLTVSFSEPVVVDTTGGIPTLQLETGTNDRYATFASGSGSSTLTFEYVVQDGDHSTDLDQHSSTALALNGGTIADAIDNTAILTLAAPGESGSLTANSDLIIDTSGPAITGIASITANGVYGIGAVINLTVSFSEPVVVDTTGGTPTLQLETGTNDRYATYTSGTGTNTLTFQYTVQGGDSSADLDQLSSTALTLNGGTISTAGGIAAILTLATPEEAGSLAANADLVIESSRNSSFILTTNFPSSSGATFQTFTNTSTTEAGTATLVEHSRGSDDTGNIVTANITPGVSIVSEGSASAQSTIQAQDSLIQSIRNASSEEEQGQIQQVKSFISSLPNTTQVDVRTIIPTSTSTVPGQRIVISESTPSRTDADSNTTSTTQTEAFVIDLRQMPKGTKMEIYNVDFAAIIGPVEVTGGSGSNVVRADDSAQIIVLGEDDDTLHGGGGNDTIGSAGGRDLLIGGDGHDKVHGGRGHDTLRGKTGRDTLTGGRGYDRLSAGRGADHLHGQRDHDHLRGKHGSDTLNGGSGNDTLIGGSGSDTFILSTGRDRIVDFNINDGDVIVISDNLNLNLSLRQRGDDVVIKDFANDIHTRVLNMDKNDTLQYQPDLI